MWKSLFYWARHQSGRHTGLAQALLWPASSATDLDQFFELRSLPLFTFLPQFGEVLAAAGHEETTVVGEIDLSLIGAVRYKICFIFFS
jgi:hypothetical protein